MFTALRAHNKGTFPSHADTGFFKQLIGLEVPSIA